MNKKTATVKDVPEKTKGEKADAKIKQDEVMARWEEQQKLTEGPDRLLDRFQVATLLGMCVNSIDKYLATGFIPSTVKESRRIFSRDRVLAYSEAIETTPKAELQAEAFNRRTRETTFVSLLETIAALYQRQVDLMKQSLAGTPADKALMDEVRDHLEEAEQMAERLELDIMNDAGVTKFFHSVENEAIPGQKYDKVVDYVKQVVNGCGLIDTIPVFKMVPRDNSNQVSIVAADKHYDPKTGKLIR